MRGLVGVPPANTWVAANAGDELRHGIVEMKLSRVDELQRRDGDDRLRHRIDAEDAVGAHGDIVRDIHAADSLCVPDLAVARDDHDESGKLARIDVHGLQRWGDARERLGGEADILRPCGWKALCVRTRSSGKRERDGGALDPAAEIETSG